MIKGRGGFFPLDSDEINVGELLQINIPRFKTQFCLICVEGSLKPPDKQNPDIDKDPMLNDDP